MSASGPEAEEKGKSPVATDSGDMELDSVSIATGQQVTIISFTLTDGNA